MEAKLKELSPKCEVLYQNADQDSSKQQSQANDGTAGGAIAAMKGGGFSPIPPTTGQDAELAAIQRILAGDQYMTVYKAIKP
jgi:hypothetical protein